MSADWPHLPLSLSLSHAGDACTHMPSEALQVLTLVCGEVRKQVRGFSISGKEWCPLPSGSSTPRMRQQKGRPVCTAMGKESNAGLGGWCLSCGIDLLHMILRTSRKARKCDVWGTEKIENQPFLKFCFSSTNFGRQSPSFQRGT